MNLQGNQNLNTINIYLYVLAWYFGLLNEEEFEDTKGVIGIRESKKNRQHNGQKKKNKSTNNDLQNIHIKEKIEQHEPH